MSFELEITNSILFLFIFLLGTAIGSFLNVVSSRLPIMIQNHDIWMARNILSLEQKEKENLNLFTPSSHCFTCKKKIFFYENIPIISFIYLRGKCSGCNAKIKIRYFITEIISGFIPLISFILFDNLILIISSIFIFYILLVLFIIDLESLILPSEITNLLLWSGLILNTQNITTTFVSAVLGIISIYFFLKTISYIYFLLKKKEGLGLGDIYFSSALGAWVGIEGIFFVILLACSFGIIFFIALLFLKKKKVSEPIAFGPFLSVGSFTYIVLLHNQLLLFNQY